MTDRARRRGLRARSLETPPGAGTYLIRNTATGRVLLGSTPNLESVRNKLEFGKSTGLAGVLDHRLRHDADQFGIDAFSFEILEVLDVTPGMTPADLRAELATLEALCREELGDALRYWLGPAGSIPSNPPDIPSTVVRSLVNQPAPGSASA